MSIHSHAARDAISNIVVLERMRDAASSTLVAVMPETGRTHQIRVHLSAIGHPIVGDATYGGARETIELDRPFLHAARLAFDQPATGERLQFEEPLPAELTEVLEQLAQ